jgi:hypothetical protein
MTTRERVIKNALPIGLPGVLMSLILDYENEARNKLLDVLHDVMLLIRIPIYIPKHNIWSGPHPKRPYRMTPVRMRVTYINLIPKHTCKICNAYPSFISYTRNVNVGKYWCDSGCDSCRGLIDWY